MLISRRRFSEESKRKCIKMIKARGGRAEIIVCLLNMQICDKMINFVMTLSKFAVQIIRLRLVISTATLTML